MARGRLRVYLGAAPGVGKTYEMLLEGRRQRGQGVDCVIDFVEPHGQPDSRADRRPMRSRAIRLCSLLTSLD